MFQLIEVMERLQQLLSLLDVLHKSGCLQAVLQNPLLQEPKPGYTLEASPTASSMLLSTKLKNLVLCPQNMWPVAGALKI